MFSFAFLLLLEHTSFAITEDEIFAFVEIFIKWICSSIVNKCRRLSKGVTCSVLEVSVTARAEEFCSNWRRDICFCGKLRYREWLVKILPVVTRK